MGTRLSVQVLRAEEAHDLPLRIWGEGGVYVRQRFAFESSPWLRFWCKCNSFTLSSNTREAPRFSAQVHVPGAPMDQGRGSSRLSGGTGKATCSFSGRKSTEGIFPDPRLQLLGQQECALWRPAAYRPLCCCALRGLQTSQAKPPSEHDPDLSG